MGVSGGGDSGWIGRRGLQQGLLGSGIGSRARGSGTPFSNDGTSSGCPLQGGAGGGRQGPLHWQRALSGQLQRPLRPVRRRAASIPRGCARNGGGGWI